jgi:hypothetical protein
MATSSTSLSMVDNSQLDYPVLLTALVVPSLWLTQTKKRTLRLVLQSLKVFSEELEVLLMLSLPLDNKRILFFYSSERKKIKIAKAFYLINQIKIQ